MDFSDKHKEKLKRLAELYARDDISDAEYQDLYRETIAEFGDSVEELRVMKDGIELPPAERPGTRTGRNGTFESVSPNRGAFDISDREEGRQPTIEISNRTARASLSAPAESEARRRRHSFLPKQPVDGSSVGSSSAHNTVYREPPRSGSSSNNPTIPRSGSAAPLSVRRRYRRRMNALLIAPAMFAFGLILAVAVTRVTSTNVEPVRKTPARTAKVVKPVAPHSNNFLQPMFGAMAVDQCTQGCVTMPEIQRPICTRGCKRLHLTAFGRRITADRVDPVVEAKEVTNRCLTRTADLERAPDDAYWHQQMTQGVASLSRLSPAAGASQRIIDVSKTLLLPATENAHNSELTFNLLKALCLRVHQTLAHAGLEEATRSSDNFSIEFYQQFGQSIEADSMDFERKVSLAIPDPLPAVEAVDASDATDLDSEVSGEVSGEVASEGDANLTLNSSGVTP